MIKYLGTIEISRENPEISTIVYERKFDKLWVARIIVFARALFCPARWTNASVVEIQE